MLRADNYRKAETRKPHREMELSGSFGNVSCFITPIYIYHFVCRIDFKAETTASISDLFLLLHAYAYNVCMYVRTCVYIHTYMYVTTYICMYILKTNEI